MSVTFATATTLPDGTIDSRCPTGCDTYENPCDRCALSVNVANGNAVLILERLGLDSGEYGIYGEAPAADFLGRALLGNVGRDDSGTAATADQLEGQATIIDCGIRAGYFGDTLGRLADLADYASRNGLLISWG
ncbi:MAG TPA: hypothetical protein VMW08_00980 [Acidimicrobiales bacterium]|nr:hypothetical protein [Acidimicrobiales bacterium]